MVRLGEKGFSYHGSRLIGGNAIRDRKECVKRTHEGLIVLTQSEESRSLHVIGFLYCESRRPRAWGYVYDGTGVKLLILPGPEPEIGALLPALSRVGRIVLSLIGRRCG